MSMSDIVTDGSDWAMERFAARCDSGTISSTRSSTAAGAAVADTVGTRIADTAGALRAANERDAWKVLASGEMADEVTRCVDARAGTGAVKAGAFMAVGKESNASAGKGLQYVRKMGCKERRDHSLL